jgi:hypothetical protein
MLEQVAVIAGYLGDQAFGGKAQPVNHPIGIALRVRDPGVRIGREVGVIGKNVLTGHIGRDLNEEAGIANEDVQRVEHLGIIEALSWDVALA